MRTRRLRTPSSSTQQRSSSLRMPLSSLSSLFAWGLVYYYSCCWRTVTAFSSANNPPHSSSIVSADFVQSTLDGSTTNGGPLLPIQVAAGMVTLQDDTGQPLQCAVLLNPSAGSSGLSTDTLVLPLERDGSASLQRLWTAQPQQQHFHKTTTTTTKGQPSLSLLFLWNSVLINRDGGLFDNLPYTSWWMESCPEQARDAAGNDIDAKYHMGKRSLYNTFMGKDWYKAQLRKTIKRNLYTPPDTVLQSRLLQMQLREVQMELAQVDSDAAILRVQQQQSLDVDKDDASFASSRTALQNKRQQLERQEKQLGKKLTALGRPQQLLDWVLGSDDNDNGGTNFATTNNDDDNDNDNNPFASPYHLLLSQLEQHMKAKVVACLLEPVHWSRNNGSCMGGAILLERQVAVRVTTILGETIAIPDETTYGNDNVQGGDLLWVECDSDEALCVSVAAKAPLFMEKEVWQSRQYPVQQQQQQESDKNGQEKVVFVDTANTTVLYTDQNASEYDTVLPLRRAAPSSLWDTLWRQSNTNAKPNQSLFPTDNPIQSLAQYDAMDNVDKVTTLQQLSNFNGRVPRPRTVRSNPQALDDLLLPLIDETVRNQYLIRDAQSRGDTDTVQRLRAKISRRQAAKEMAERGQPDAQAWEEEALFLESLRADATQDEGSYSRFLDRDDWYERNRQRTARRVKKSKFGTLLDGLE